MKTLSWTLISLVAVLGLSGCVYEEHDSGDRILEQSERSGYSEPAQAPAPARAKVPAVKPSGAPITAYLDVVETAMNSDKKSLRQHDATITEVERLVDEGLTLFAETRKAHR